MNVKRPNILMIMSDNHSADLLGCYGNEEVETPHLDQLAEEGIRFDNAFCVNAMCSPCRASVLTGLMPSQHGIHTWIDDRKMDSWPPNWNALAEFATLPEILKAHGYKTALIGKYHLGAPFAPQNGFEEWITFPHGHTRSFWDNTVIENDQTYRYPGHTVDFFTEKTVAYLKSHDPDQPFFLFLTYNGPYGHWPAIKGPARNRFAPRYAETPMNSVPREGISREMIERVLLTMADSGDGLDYTATLRIPNELTSLRNYFSQMSMVDDGVGQVLAALQEQGLNEDTLVIYTADHGFSLGQHGFWGHGQATWPANTHRAAFSIPLLMRHTAHLPPAQASDRLVSQVDLFATLLDYVGIKSPASDLPSPSRTLAPLLKGEEEKEEQKEGAAAWDEALFMEQEETRAIRTPEWLYMERFRGSPHYPLQDALYHVAQDAGEKHNLIADPAYADVIDSLKARLHTYFDQHATPKYDLWQGGTTKSNTSRPWLWADAWGDSWAPIFHSSS